MSHNLSIDRKLKVWINEHPSDATYHVKIDVMRHILENYKLIVQRALPAEDASFEHISNLSDVLLLSPAGESAVSFVTEIKYKERNVAIEGIVDLENNVHIRRASSFQPPV